MSGWGGYVLAGTNADQLPAGNAYGRCAEMTDEKICPIMSRGEQFEDFTLCQKEKCMAWVPECPNSHGIRSQITCDPSDCDIEGREYGECKGGCRLI
jgi:hypothetical protein